MRPWLRWLLALSALASALALWWPDNVSQAVKRSAAAISGSSAAFDGVRDISTASGGGQPATALPKQLAVLTLTKTDFDPFAGLQPPPAAPQPIAAVAAPPPPAPMAPALSYRYVGQMVDPAGKRYVYLGNADKELLVVVGTQLDGGYVVEAIDASAVRLHYPPLDTRAVINIPVTKESSNP